MSWDLMLALLSSEVFLSSFLELRLRTLHLEPVLLQAYLFSFLELKSTALHLQLVLVLLRASLFFSFPAAVGLDPLVFAEMTLTHFAVQVAAAAVMMMKPTLILVALDLSFEVVSTKSLDLDLIPVPLQVLIRTHPTLGERWRACVR